MLFFGRYIALSFENGNIIFTIKFCLKLCGCFECVNNNFCLKYLLTWKLFVKNLISDCIRHRRGVDPGTPCLTKARLYNRKTKVALCCENNDLRPLWKIVGESITCRCVTKAEVSILLEEKVKKKIVTDQ